VPPKSHGLIPAMRVPGAARFSAADVNERICNDWSFEVEKVALGRPFEMEFPEVLYDMSRLSQVVERGPRRHEIESELSIALWHQLNEVNDLPLIRDPEFWTWLGLFPFRNYVLGRWFGGFDSELPQSNPKRCSYFLTGDSLREQARNAVRKLWLVANTSWRADSSFAHVGAFLASTDLYTGIFERMIGLDPEIAIAISSQVVDLEEASQRQVIRSVCGILSTTSLETMKLAEKRQLVGVIVDRLRS